MEVSRALMGGVYFPADTAAAMWRALEGHAFDYIGVSLSAMRGGSYEADVSVLGVSCSFTIKFDTPEEARQFFAVAPFDGNFDEATCTAAYIRIGVAAGLEHCIAAQAPEMAKGEG